MSGSARQVLRNGMIVDGSEGEPYLADLAIRGDRIEAIGDVPAESGDVDVDCTGRLLMPGFVDAHSHGDGKVFDPDVQLALLRQGVTTLIGGQDGVSYAPGNGRYAAEYFAAINGPHPTYRGSRVSHLLTTYDHTTRINVAYLVPAGTVRHEVMGRSTATATAQEMGRMRYLITAGLRDGAVGLSSGLDYVPGLYSDTAELTALCEPVAAAGAVYVTHMRGGYEANSAAGVSEIATINRHSGVRTHISHFHAAADTLLPILAGLLNDGIETTFDAYPYTRGCTLLAMPLLPPELAIRPVDEILVELASPKTRAALRRDWFPLVDQKPSLGREWPTMITLGHIRAPEYAWAHGLTIAEGAVRAGVDVIDFALDVLLASQLEVNAIMAVRYARPVEELGRILSHEQHVGGSDGIFVGAHPHPRAHGTFARYLREFVREHNFYTWAVAVAHLATRPAEIFQLGQRGRLAPGQIADLIVVDPAAVADRATYEHPRALATGIDDVFVAGERVLRDGHLTEVLPGRGLRRVPIGR
ncbi:amidohydrolase family protein [Cryobacterium sp. Hh11]|uniref:N-acyl-D-amino-acid deacylase family protein n=1 Tax=Cryobacterium sp. Hh11 TaxID=2555868 RepID=UPI00141A7412|nr:amidohydrolase family protein [Cryobacterium sp. Hh11]